MRKAIIAIIICLGLTNTACAKTSNNVNQTDLLIGGDFQSVQVYEDIHKSEKSIITISDTKKIKQIINRINNSKREDSEGITFEKGPEGLLIFKDQGGVTIKVPFFKDSGDVLYKKSFIDSNLLEILK